MPNNPKTAAEWMDRVERVYTSVIPGVMDSSELADTRALLAMLRDAKAEMEWRPCTGDRVQVDGFDETGMYCNGYHGEALGHVGACCMLVRLDDGRGTVTVGWRQLSKADGGWAAIEEKWKRGDYAK